MRKLADWLGRPASACLRFLAPEPSGRYLVRWAVAYGLAHVVTFPCAQLAFSWAIHKVPRIADVCSISFVCGSVTGIASWVTVLATLLIAARTSKLLADSAKLRGVLLRVGLILFIFGSVFEFLGTF